MTTKYYISDTELSERFPIYTRANVGEVFPDPVTPLTSTGFMFRSELGWRDAWFRMGAFAPEEFPAEEFCQLGVIGGYCYLNASLIRLFGERAPGLSWKDMDEQFFGAQPGIPPYEEMAGDQRPEATEKIGETFGWALSLRVGRRPRRADGRPRVVDPAAGRATGPLVDDERGAVGEQFQEQVAPIHRDCCSAHHLFTTYMATVPVGIISGVATAVERPDLIMPIIAGIGRRRLRRAVTRDVGAWVATVAGDAELTARVRRWGLDGLLDRLADDRARRSRRTRSSTPSIAFLLRVRLAGPQRVGDALAHLGHPTRRSPWAPSSACALRPTTRSHRPPNTRRSQHKRERGERLASCSAMVEADAETHGQLAAAHRLVERSVASGARAHQDQQHPLDPRDAQCRMRETRAPDGGGSAGSTRSRTSGS